MTKKVSSITGQELREMFAAATAWLEKNAPDIDELNVFPVPDGDTGTNMLLTMRSSVEEAYRAPDTALPQSRKPWQKRAAGRRGNRAYPLSDLPRYGGRYDDKEEISRRFSRAHQSRKNSL